MRSFPDFRSDSPYYLLLTPYCRFASRKKITLNRIFSMADLPQTPSSLRSLIALYVSTFFSGAWAMIIPTIPVLAGEFGVSAGGAAQVITGFAFGKMAGTVLGGVLLDRKGTRFGLVGSALVAALASFCAAWVAWFWLLVFFAFVLGATDTLGAVAREIAAIDQAQRGQRGRIVSSLHGAHTIGAAVCPFIGGWLTELFNYRAAFVGYAVVSAASVFLGLLVTDSPGEAHGRAPAAGGLTGWSVAGIKQRIGALALLYREIRVDLRSTYCSIVFATLVNQSQRIIVQSMLPLYAVRYLHLSPSEIGMLFSMSGVVIFAVMISRRLSDGPRRPQVVHGTEHSDPGADILLDPYDHEFHAAGDAYRHRRGRPRFVRSARWRRPLTMSRRPMCAGGCKRCADHR